MIDCIFCTKASGARYTTFSGYWYTLTGIPIKTFTNTEKRGDIAYEHEFSF